ncbi:Kinase, NEK [Giardia lamblia P15]|uniref:Kinase, NEK n=1 Tax=Giardia intestinalis (strain P15) TaxID=658858 RepID=E1F1A6_GIAIA|nr:Kinase, NEK [Giardia lamblia P15]
MRLWLADYHVVSLVSQTPFSSMHKVTLRDTKQDFLAETIDMRKLSSDEQHRFREYLELYRRCNCNNLMRIYKIVENRNKQRITIVMEQHGTLTLADIYASYKNAGLAVPEPILWNTIAQITVALNALLRQDKSFQHANIHPANCFVDQETGILRLGLFLPFLLKYEKEEQSTRESITGLIERVQKKLHGTTAAHASCVQSFTDYGQRLTLVFPPEVFQGQGILPVSDMWMLGCLLFEGCNGLNPFLEGVNTTPSVTNPPYNKKCDETSESFARLNSTTNDHARYFISERSSAPLELNYKTKSNEVYEDCPDITLVDSQDTPRSIPTVPHTSLASIAILPSISFATTSMNKDTSFESMLIETSHVQYNFEQFVQHVLTGKRAPTNPAYSRNLQMMINLCLNQNIKTRVTLDTLCRHPLIVKFLTSSRDEMVLRGKLVLYTVPQDSLHQTDTILPQTTERVSISDLKEEASSEQFLGNMKQSESLMLCPIMESDASDLPSRELKHLSIERSPGINGWNNISQKAYITELDNQEESSDLFSNEFEVLCTTNLSTTSDSCTQSENSNETNVVCDFDNLVSGKKEEEPSTILMIAALKNDIDLIKENRKSDLRRRCPSGKTALMFAAQQGHTEAVQLLLKEAGMKKRTGKTALMIAAELGHHNIVSLLVNVEAGIQDRDLWTALMRAAWFGHSLCCEYLVAEEGRFTRKNGWTALMCAAYRGHANVCRVLAPREAEMYTDAGYTALMYAARYGHYECCKVLARYETGMKNRYRQTALVIAAERMYGEIAMLLLNAETEACEQKDKSLQLSQFQMSRCTPCGSIRNSPHGGSVGPMTPYRPFGTPKQRPEPSSISIERDKLHLSDLHKSETATTRSDTHRKKETGDSASYVSPMEKASYLSLSVKSSFVGGSFYKSDSTVSSRAISRPESADKKLTTSVSSTPTLRLNSLLSGYVKPTLRQRSDFRTNCTILTKQPETYTEMMTAALKDDLREINRLIARQATIQTERGRTCLMLCAEKGLIHPVRLLIGREAGMQDNSGWTALMHAAVSGKENVVPLLSTAEARMQDHVGNTAMMFAARYGYINIVKALMCYELGIKDRNGWTALLHAVDADQLECVKLLVAGEFSMCDNYQSMTIDYCKEGPVKDVLLNHYMCSLQT